MIILKELEFEIPDYIKQEIDEYITNIKDKKGVSGKWLNIRTLLRVAMVNNKLTYDQVTLIEEKIRSANQKLGKI